MDGSAAPLTEAAGGEPAPAAPRYIRQYELVEAVRAYHPGLDERLINAAYVYAVQKHGAQLRASGDPYFSHPVAVAGLLAELKLDEHTIVAGLLHDTVEDTDATLDEIEAHFGRDVAELVDGVTKLTRLQYRSEETKQAENFQKLILATTNDVRVLLVKLADRLHNMRTLHFVQKPEKRERIARETMDLYAPLARRVGLYGGASELEDLAFEQINPQARAAIKLRLDELSSANKDDIERVRADLKTLLEDIGVEGEVRGRRKQPYSIWRKLEKKSISFRDVADIFAFRVIVKDPADCYRVLGAAHTQWACLPDRFKDYISVPKPNGYRSLHTTVRASGNRRVELQIRTAEMNETAERGVAAHWAYKDSAYTLDHDAAKAAGLDAEASLRAFADLFSEGGDPEEFLEHAKLEMYRDHVFVFTPKGKLVVLPGGALPLDFAYALHTAIGDTCTGVRINGEPRPLRTPLRSGDVVEIIRGKSPAPAPQWEALTTTGRARSAIRRLVRTRETAEFHSLGRGMIEQALRRASVDPLEVDISEMAAKTGRKSTKSFFEAVGRGRISAREAVQTIFPAIAEDTAIEFEAKTPTDDAHVDLLVAGENLTAGVTLHLGRCCSPLPGDRIIGVPEAERGLVVHTIDCQKLAEFESRHREWVDLRWTPLAQTEAIAVGRIKISAINKKGVLATLCAAVAQSGGNITRIATGERNEDFIDLNMDIEVEDLKRLTQILAALRSLAVVDRAERLLER